MYLANQFSLAGQEWSGDDWKGRILARVDGEGGGGGGRREMEEMEEIGEKKNWERFVKIREACCGFFFFGGWEFHFGGS